MDNKDMKQNNNGEKEKFGEQRTPKAPAKKATLARAQRRKRRKEKLLKEGKELLFQNKSTKEMEGKGDCNLLGTRESSMDNKSMKQNTNGGVEESGGQNTPEVPTKKSRLFLSGAERRKLCKEWRLKYKLEQRSKYKWTKESRMTSECRNEMAKKKKENLKTQQSVTSSGMTPESRNEMAKKKEENLKTQQSVTSSGMTPECRNEIAKKKEENLKTQQSVTSRGMTPECRNEIAKKKEEHLKTQQSVTSSGISPECRNEIAKKKEETLKTQQSVTSSGIGRMEHVKTLDLHCAEGRAIDTSEDLDSTVPSIFWMAVIQEGFPIANLSLKQAEEIQSRLFEKVEKGRNGPKFKDIYLDKGALIFVCADSDSTRWLRETLSEINPWKETKLLVKTVAELFKTVKVSVWVPKTHKDVLPTILWETLQAQNNISTKNWRTIDRKVEENGQRVEVEIDEKSLCELMNKNLRLYLGLTEVHFSILREVNEYLAAKWNLK